MQDGDVKLFNTPDGGEVSVESGVFLMDGGLETMVYLALFGGNMDDSGRASDHKQWWGNADEPDERTYRSETQHLLRSLPAIPVNLRRIEDAARRDLNLILTESIADTVALNVSLIALNTIEIEVFIGAEGEVTRFSFVENWGVSVSSAALDESIPDKKVSFDAETFEGIAFEADIPTPGFEFVMELGVDGGDVLLDWGDGDTEVVSPMVATEVRHTYSAAGEFRILTTGVGYVSELNFEGGTGEQVTKILSFGGGPISIHSLLHQVDISGLVSVPNKAATTGGVINAFRAFGRSSFNLPIGNWDTQGITTMGEMFVANPAFNQDISGWDVRNVTSMGGMFNQSPAFNQDVSSWDVSSVSIMSSMFRNASAFNQDIGGWDTRSLQHTSFMFFNCFGFDQNLGGWDVTQLRDARSMFGGSAILSTANYDALLIGWAAQSVRDNVLFGATNCTYTAGGAAEAARDSLINDHGWVITDAGPV